MKIAIFHELPTGGARRAVNEIAKRLKGNHTVDLFLLENTSPGEEKKFYTNTYFFKFIPKQWEGHNWKAKLYKDTVELIQLYLKHRQIAAVIDKKNYDIVFVHPSKFTQAPFILRFLKTKTIYYCEEIYRIMYEPIFKYQKSEHPLRYIYEALTRSIKKTLDKKNISSADSILANSKHTQKGLKKFYGIKSTVCYLGVDTNFFIPKKINKDIDALFIGSLDYEADEYTLFKMSLNFVKKDVSTKVLGGENSWISDKELLSIYRRARMVICTAHNEPFGLVPLEAMACATPVIAVNEGGYKETIINGKTGFLIKRSPFELAAKIDYLLTNQKKSILLGRNGRMHVERNWSWEKSVSYLEKILKEPKA